MRMLNALLMSCRTKPEAVDVTFAGEAHLDACRSLIIVLRIVMGQSYCSVPRIL